MENIPTYTITISRKYVEGNNCLNVERTVTNAEDGEVIFHSLHEISSDSEKESPIAYLEKHLYLYPPESQKSTKLQDELLRLYVSNIHVTESERQSIERALNQHNIQFDEHPLSSHINRLYNISKNEL